MNERHEGGMGVPSIQAREDEFLQNLELLDDDLLQFEYILGFIDDLNGIPEGQRTDDCKVEGCVSNAWLIIDERDGLLSLRLDADSLLIEGLLGVLTWMLDLQPLPDVAAWQPRLLEHPRTKPLLTIDRRQGISSVVKAIQTFCMANTAQ